MNISEDLFEDLFDKIFAAELTAADFVVVPIKPTRDMCNAFEVASNKAWADGGSTDDALPAFEAGYAAMLKCLEKE